jgi:hypothetical protein
MLHLLHPSPGEDVLCLEVRTRSFSASSFPGRCTWSDADLARANDIRIYRHWGCVTPAIITNIKKELSGGEEDVRIA